VLIAGASLAIALASFLWAPVANRDRERDAFMTAQNQCLQTLVTHLTDIESARLQDKTEASDAETLPQGLHATVDLAWISIDAFCDASKLHFNQKIFAVAASAAATVELRAAVNGVAFIPVTPSTGEQVLEQYEGALDDLIVGVRALQPPPPWTPWSG
jgi:hypothetical protein